MTVSTLFAFRTRKPPSFTLATSSSKVLPNLLMIDTYSGSLGFIVITEDLFDFGEREMRNLDNDIRHRLNLSGEFFAQFNMKNGAGRKQVSLYEFHNVEHGIICAICVNPKEYFELFGIYYETNKKHKGVRKGTKRVDFDNYISCILTLEEAKEGSKRFGKKQKQTL